MARQVGPVHIEALHGAVLGIPAITGYVAPNLQGARIAHTAEIDPTKGQSGKTTGIMLNDEILECEFEYLPEGASTLAAAVKSASIPRAGAFLQISGLEVVQIGPFTDAYNTNGVNTQPWIYVGGGVINATNDGKWTVTLPCRRYPLIPSNAVITES